MTTNAAIYTPSQSPLALTDLNRLALGASIEQKRGLTGQVTQMQVKWNDCRVRINFMESGRLAEHIQGFLGYVLYMQEETKWLNHETEQRTQVAIDRIGATKQVLGMVIEPTFDKAGKCITLICGLTTQLNGLFFAFDSIYDGDGSILLGVQGAPEFNVGI